MRCSFATPSPPPGASNLSFPSRSRTCGQRATFGLASGSGTYADAAAPGAAGAARNPGSFRPPRPRWPTCNAAAQHANDNHKQESTHRPARNARRATARPLLSVLLRCTAATRPRQKPRTSRRSARQGRAPPRPWAPAAAPPCAPGGHRRRPPAGYAVTTQRQRAQRARVGGGDGPPRRTRTPQEPRTRAG